MTRKLMGALLASAFINCAIAADEGFVYPFQQINLGGNAVASLSDPNLDQTLITMKEGYPIGPESIKIVSDFLTSGNHDLNNIDSKILSRFLTCVKARLKIDSTPKKALDTYVNNYGSQVLRENFKVSYNIEARSFHGTYNHTHVQIDSQLLMTVYYLLKEQAEKLVLEAKTQSVNDKYFYQKFSAAVGEATNLTQGKSQVEHYSILEANIFTIINRTTNEKESRPLKPNEILKILSWIYQGGTLGDLFEESAKHHEKEEQPQRQDAEQLHRQQEEIRRKAEEKQRKEAEELSRRENDRHFSQKYNIAVEEARNLTQNQPEAQHFSILEANRFTIINRTTNEKENCTLKPNEILKILSWIYQGGTLGDSFEKSTDLQREEKHAQRKAEQLRRQQEQKEVIRRKAEEAAQEDIRKQTKRVQEKHKLFIQRSAVNVPAAFRYFALPTYATYDQVRNAFKRASMRAHPDKGGSEDQIKQVNNQFEILQAYFRKGIFEGL